jgi:hypothetical protein
MTGSAGPRSIGSIMLLLSPLSYPSNGGYLLHDIEICPKNLASKGFLKKPNGHFRQQFGYSQ